MFQECSNLDKLDVSNFKTNKVTDMSFMFNNCSNLIDLDVSDFNTENVTNMISMFQECSKLNNVSLPVCTSIGQQAFYYCSSLGQIYLPECTALNNNAFISCTKLSTASFPKCSNIRTGAFSSCKKLESLYLMNTSVITISTNVFTSSPMGQSSWLGHYGSIYVPQSLLATYQSATNWTSLSARLVGV